MKKAFTLVELIVVISVLGILSTIGFVSYVGYAQDSRDGVRVANLNDIKKGLELKKSQTGEFPSPDNSYSVQYLGKEVWKQGTLGNNTKKQIKFNAIEMDPKYDTDYSYSVSSNGKRFELGTVLEDETNSPLSYLFGNTYASGDEKALNFGNLRGKFHVAKVNGETHVFSIPSMIFRDSSDVNVVVDQPTTQFSVTGEGALPESYVGVTEVNEEITFTPRLLYRGPNCGVETDQEIVNFVSTLRDSFNYEPYLSNPDYQDIFNDYNTLRNNMTDFETLKKLGLKINKLLDCDIKSFKTVDIFPTQCGYEGLNFEGVDDGFNIEEESCLFTYNVSSPYGSTGPNGLVRDGEGKDGTKGLHIQMNGSYQSSTLKYRVFTYVPVKFEYDIKTSVIDSGSYIDFYINGFKYYRLEPGNDYSVDYEKFSTDLLPPGLYDFEWRVHRQYYDDTQLWLDNLDFTCVGGGPLCGFTGGFEPGNDNLEFEGYVPMPWIKIDDATEGNVAIKNPTIPHNQSTEVVYTKNLTAPSRLSFDFKMDYTAVGEMRVYIDGIEQKFWSNRLPMGDDIETSYQTYVTPLLPAGEHSLTVKIKRQNHYVHNVYAYLDNFKIYCSEGEVGCGMDMSFENDDTPFLGYFSFDGVSENPWPIEHISLEPDYVNHGDMAIRNPMIPNSSSTYMYYHKDFDEPAKISFDYKIRQAGSWAKFYIDDVEYKKIGYQTSESGSSSSGTGGTWSTFTTPLLTGKHTIKIQVYKYYHTGSWGSNVYLYLDNFRLSCYGDQSLPENSGCGLGYDMETSNLDIYRYGGTKNVPWKLTTGSGGGQAIENPRLVYGDTNTLEFDYNIGSGQDLKMDIDILQGSSNRVHLYVDDGLYRTWTSSHNMSDFTEYTVTGLTPGNHTFQFFLDNKNTKYPITVKLDNIRAE